MEVLKVINVHISVQKFRPNPLLVTMPTNSGHAYSFLGSAHHQQIKQPPNCTGTAAAGSLEADRGRVCSPHGL